MPERPMTSEAATAAAEALCSGVIPFPPSGELAITFLASEIFRMCPTIESAEWLVRRAFTLWRKWEGVPELRALLCSKYRPRDGAETTTTLFAGGIVPPEIPQYHQPQLPPAPLEATPEEIEARRKAAAAGLPEGHSVSADVECEAMVRRVARRMSTPEDVRRRLAEVAGLSPDKPFDRKQAEREVREILAEQSRNRRAKAEGGGE
jgi:hypothetical protein